MGHCMTGACLDPETDQTEIHFYEAMEHIELSEIIDLYTTVFSFLGITTDGTIKMAKTSQ